MTASSMSGAGLGGLGKAKVRPRYTRAEGWRPAIEHRCGPVVMVPST